MSFGFNVHIICGQIASISAKTIEGTKVVNVRLKSGDKTDKKDSQSFWVDASLWGRNAENFLKGSFRSGDKIAFSLGTLKQSLWKDKDGEYHAGLRGNVDKYWDLRHGPKPGPEAGKAPRGEKLPRGAGPFPETPSFEEAPKDQSPDAPDEDAPKGPRP
ncbi:MAG: single-stranded DNA-binding protein [Deltaproteobacteria bacterium]|jgi:single-stranded DNA-binding protein|nr:single-stranded DNA-binding protein [Deltaproteobacteria bacterium]